MLHFKVKVVFVHAIGPIQSQKCKESDDDFAIVHFQSLFYLSFESSSIGQ